MKRILLVASLILVPVAGGKAFASAVPQAPNAVFVKRALDAEALYRSAIARIVPAYVMIGGGSGVVISPEGLMLTNHHVIAREYDKGKVKDWDVRVGSKFYKADVLGADTHGDIALLQIREADKLPFVPFADSDRLITGQQVIAVGNPFGTMKGVGDPTVTMGVISCLHRFQGSYSDAIQTDTPINPGNSGGPLLTMDGQLAGINGRIQAKHGARANTGIGLAIPTNQINRFLPLLKKAGGGLVHHGELRGLKGDDTESDGIQNGAEIKEVMAGTPAEKMGFKAGDRITHIDGMPILNFLRLLGVVGTYPADSEVPVKLERNKKAQTLSLKLEKLDRGALGFSIDPGVGQGQQAFQNMIKLRQNADLALPITVKEIQAFQPAAKSGLKVGDVIVEVDGSPIPNVRRFQEQIQKMQVDGRVMPGDKMLLKVKRGGEVLTITLELGSQAAALESKVGKKGNGG